MDDYLDFAKKVTQVKVDEKVLERVKDTYYKTWKTKMPECFPSLEGTNSRDYEEIGVQSVDDVEKILAEEKAAGGLLNKELKQGTIKIVPVYQHSKAPVDIQKGPEADDGISSTYNKTTNYKTANLTKEQQDRIFETLKILEARRPELPHPGTDTLSMEEIMLRSGCKPPEPEHKKMPVREAKRKINQIIVFYLDKDNEQQYWNIKETLPANVQPILVKVLKSEQCRTESIILQE